jgi:putative transposase
VVNRKRVLRMMREDNPLVVQPRAFVVTTDSDHQFKIYLNLASRMKLTGMRRCNYKAAQRKRSVRNH